MVLIKTLTNGSAHVEAAPGITVKQLIAQVERALATPVGVHHRLMFQASSYAQEYVEIRDNDWLYIKLQITYYTV